MSETGVAALHEPAAAGSSVAALLEVSDLAVEYRAAGQVVRAVQGVSFTVRAGEVMTIVGESGCGKSATALSLLGLLGPSGSVVRGSARFDGADLLTMPPAELRRIRGGDVAMVFQDPLSALNPLLTVRTQIVEQMRLHRSIRTGAARARAAELLELVGVPAPERVLGAHPHQLSGGMRQRVMIAMALSCSPRLLIADEPTTSLDVTIQAQILDLLGRLQRELGMAVLLITHDLGIVAGIADEVAVMYGGRLVETGSVEGVLDRPAHPYTQGLLDSIPRLDLPVGTALVPISGAPPDLSRLIAGCAFAPRCRFAQPNCKADTPALKPIAPTRRVACWYPREGEQR